MKKTYIYIKIRKTYFRQKLLISGKNSLFQAKLSYFRQFFLISGKNPYFGQKYLKFNPRLVFKDLYSFLALFLAPKALRLQVLDQIMYAKFANLAQYLCCFFAIFSIFFRNSLCQSENSILKYKPRVEFKVFLPEIRKFCLK